MVRRHTRKDPGQNYRRAGRSACVLLTLLTVVYISSPPVSAASTQGPAAKTTSVEPAVSESKPIHFNLNFLPWRKASAARQTVESAVAKAQPATPPPPVSSGTSYLSTGGPLPLRFASARTWPARMSPSDEAALSLALAPDPDLAITRDPALAQAAATPNTDGSPPTGPAGGAVTITASSADAAIPREPQIVARPILYANAEEILTTELVLHSLEGMPSTRGAVPSQFRPAQPKDRSFDSVPAAVAP